MPGLRAELAPRRDPHLRGASVRTPASPTRQPGTCGPGPIGLAALRRMGRYYLDLVPGGPREVERIIASGCRCEGAPAAPAWCDPDGSSCRDPLRCSRCWTEFVQARFDGCCPVCRVAIARELVQGHFQTALELIQKGGA